MWKQHHFQERAHQTGLNVCFLAAVHYRAPKYCILYNWIEYRESATWCLLTLGNSLVKSKIVLNHGFSPAGCKVKHNALSRAGPQRMQVIKGGGEKLTKPLRILLAFLMPLRKKAKKHIITMCWAAQLFQVVIYTKSVKKALVQYDGVSCAVPLAQESPRLYDANSSSPLSRKGQKQSA